MTLGSIHVFFTYFWLAVGLIQASGILDNAVQSHPTSDWLFNDDGIQSLELLLCVGPRGSTLYLSDLVTRKPPYKSRRNDDYSI